MHKEDNDWEIEVRNHGCEGYNGNVKINDTCYPHVSTDTACLAHSILLLVDGINDLCQEVRANRLTR